jgi:hypothetical protein
MRQMRLRLPKALARQTEEISADPQVHKRQRTSVSMYAESSESDEAPPFAGPSQPDPPLSVLDLLRSLGSDMQQASHLPSSRNTTPVSMSSPSYLSKCDKVMAIVVKVAASIIYPANADQYATRFHPRLDAGVSVLQKRFGKHHAAAWNKERCEHCFACPFRYMTPDLQRPTSQSPTRRNRTSLVTSTTWTTATTWTAATVQMTRTTQTTLVIPRT